MSKIRQNLKETSYHIHKIINDKPPQPLGIFEEIKGLLEDIRKRGNELILTFRIQKKITIPYSKIFEGKLSKVIGKKVGLLRTDSAEKPTADMPCTSLKVS